MGSAVVRARIASVLSSFRKPVLAKLNFLLPRRRGPAIVCQLLGLFFVFSFVPKQGRADSFEDSARTLAHKIALSIHAVPATCEFRNLSSLRGTEFEKLIAAFEQELQRRGVRIAAADDTIKLVISISQDPTEYLAVVQIQRKESTETVIESMGPVNGPSIQEPSFHLTLHREYLLSQEQPLLDVVLESGERHAEALGTQSISSYELRGDQWELTGVEPLPLEESADRGQRGIYLAAGIYARTVFFRREVCRISTAEGKAWNCSATTEHIPAKAVAQEALAGKNLGLWFSAAQFEMDGKTNLIVTGQDGLARLYADGAEPVAVFPNWGSEIASVYSGCGSGWQLLVTGRGDWTAPDEIQAIDLQEWRAQTVSDPLEFPGPIVALHPAEERSAANPSADGMAIAVVRNLQNGRYEAYLLSIACAK